MKKSYTILWFLFIVFIAIRLLFKIQYWIVLSVETCGLAIFLLIKAGIPAKKHVLISVAFALLSTIAYLGYQRNPWILLYGIHAGLSTLLCSLAVFSVMEKKSAYALVSKNGKSPFCISILIGVAVGAMLSVINILISGQKLNIEFSLWKLLICLNPAIYEEMACRAIFMAFCIWCSEGKMNLFQSFTMYFMMCIPHSAVHGYPLPATLLLSVLFGFPFALMQRKRDISCAMLSHGIVDAVRFTLIGM